MKPSLQTIPGYGINEYLVMLNPHEDLRNRVSDIKQEFHERFQSSHAYREKPRIALATFTQFAMMEERIVNRLKVIAMGYCPFKVELKDFGSYPAHTIFVNVTTKEPIRNLVREIKPVQQLLKLNNEHKPHFFDDPHITVARKLLPWQYEKAWLEFSNRSFTGRFIADSMLLLGRRQEEKGYRIIQRFEFSNLPVAIKQGELFA